MFIDSYTFIIGEDFLRQNLHTRFYAECLRVALTFPVPQCQPWVQASCAKWTAGCRQYLEHKHNGYTSIQRLILKAIRTAVFI